MKIAYKLEPIPDFNNTLHLKRGWRVLLEDGNFELYETHVGEWTTSLKEHMRWPNKLAAIRDTIQSRLATSPVVDYLRCRAKRQEIILTCKHP